MRIKWYKFKAGVFNLRSTDGCSWSVNQLKLNLDVKGVDSFLSSQPQMDLSDVLKNSQLLLSSVTHFLFYIISPLFFQFRDIFSFNFWDIAQVTACNYCFLLLFLLCFVPPEILCCVYIHLCDIDTFKERGKKNWRNSRCQLLNMRIICKRQ